MQRPTKLDKLLWLLEEVRIADKFIEDNGPEDMGYVHTAKDYIQNRADDLKTELSDEYGFDKGK
tara:strand:+ start:233 stop:424 length:192 start_codon:yes stop_codon:yes gene_type:complete